VTRQGCSAAALAVALLYSPPLLAQPPSGAAPPNAAPLPGTAQQPNPAPSGEGQPIEIQSDSGIEWQQDAQVYIARGNVVVTRGTTELHADTVIAHYRPNKGGNQSGSADAAKPNKSAKDAAKPNAAETPAGQDGANQIYRVDADGNVVIKDPTRTIVGDHAVWDVDQATGVVTGKALKMTTAVDLVTARDALEWYDQKQVGVARGDAVATRGPKTIKADVLTAYFVKTDAKPAGGKPAAAGSPAAPAAAKPAVAKPAAAAASKASNPLGDSQTGGSKISRVDAQGHVVVLSQDDVGHGDYGVYNADTGICTLLGNVVFSRDKDVVRGQYGVMDLNTNVARILPAASLPGGEGGRVEGLFVRQDPSQAAGQNAGKDKPSGVDGKTP
jgi:lipopolysaccharide export system protein LptA